MKNSISNATINRLPIYLRYLERISVLGAKNASSQDIGEALGFNSSQVRKDLSYFGDFGKKGVGYNVDILIHKIRQILNLDQSIPICLVGMGRLGQALCQYNRYQNDTMKIKAVFDSNKDVIGSEINELAIQPINELQKTIKRKNIRIGIICVPQQFAQEIANIMIHSGIEAILNFAPVFIKGNEHVKIHNVDFTADLHSLAYFLKKKTP